MDASNNPKAGVLDALDEQAQKEATGGGIVCQFRFEAGFKLFIKNLDNRKSFFPYSPGNKPSQDAALELAKKVAIEYGHTSPPQTAAQLVIFKNSVKGREVKWKDDRFFTYPIWTDAYKGVLKPALVQCGINSIGEYWGKIGFVADPSGRKTKDANGQEKAELVAFPAELYADEAAALKAAGPVNGTNGHVSTPQGYTTETWAKQESDIRALRLGYIQKGMDATAATAKAAQDYGATVEQVCALLGISPEVIPF